MIHALFSDPCPKPLPFFIYLVDDAETEKQGEIREDRQMLVQYKEPFPLHDGILLVKLDPCDDDDNSDDSNEEF